MGWVRCLMSDLVWSLHVIYYILKVTRLKKNSGINPIISVYFFLLTPEACYNYDEYDEQFAG